MPNPKVRKIIKRYIKPPEVYGIADQFRRAADRVDGLGGDLDHVAAEMDPTWEGNSKNKFFANFRPIPGQVRSLANLLRHLASEVESITVEIDVEVWE
jgi:WXG100 family type VII secretion target